MAIVRRLAGVIFLAAGMMVVQVEYPFAYARAAAANIEIAQAQTDSPAATPPASTAPAATSTAPPPSPEPAKPPGDKPATGSDSASSVDTPVFPTAIDPKYGHEPGIVSRMRTCADQFTANKATNANGGMKWIDRSGGYYGACVKHLKG